MMNNPDKAVRNFDNGFNCSQSVLSAFAPDLGISEDTSLKIACAFGAGMGRLQLTCGAVTGALMALGLKYGKGLYDNESAKQRTYTLTRNFCEEFSKKHGSLNCRELLMGLDMNDPDQNMKIRELGLHDSKCAVFVRDAAGIMETLIS